MMEGESYRPRKKKLMSDINVVPYIDVMLVLLIIFMITAPLLKQGVDVQLPQAKARAVDTKDQENLVVTVDRQGRYFLDDRQMSADALGKKASAMIALRPQIQVLVRGDRDVPYGKVVQAMVLLQAAGAKSVGLLTEPLKTK
ncbi:MAG: protein TolR [Acidiferrobacterales bacterium]|jgi:biopolymer transport protein TolR|nr:protein TolR [Acidiferrobacterales bacterium]